MHLPKRMLSGTPHALPPDACLDVFARLAAEKMLPTADAWARVRKLLENNQLAEARKSASFIPNLPSNFERITALIGQSPVQYLQREKLQPLSPASVELFLFAVTRLARTDADQAATLLEARGKKLPANDLGYAWAQIGLYGGMQHDQGALAWFERTAGFRLNDTQAGWKARAALRAGDWPSVRAAINAMSDLERRESAWRYWLARAPRRKPVMLRLHVHCARCSQPKTTSMACWQPRSSACRLAPIGMVSNHPVPRSTR